MESQSVTTTEQYFTVVLFVVLYKVALNLVPRAFSLFKMAVRDSPGQGCWNTPRIVKRKVAFSQVVCSVWRPSLFSAIGNYYSNKTKTFHRVCVTKFWRTFWSHFGSLGQGFLRLPFSTRRSPWERGWVALTLQESVEEILKCDHSNESY